MVDAEDEADCAHVSLLEPWCVSSVGYMKGGERATIDGSGAGRQALRPENRRAERGSDERLWGLIDIFRNSGRGFELTAFLIYVWTFAKVEVGALRVFGVQLVL